MNNEFNELSKEQLMAVDGGIAPIIIAGAKILGAAFLAGAGTRLGEAAYDEIKSWF